MKTAGWYLILIALLCCVIAAIAQEVDHSTPQLPEGEMPQDSHEHIPEGEKPEDSSSEGIMCPTLIMRCPDNTNAIQNAYCQYICGASPIGNLSYDEVDGIMDKFMDTYIQVEGARITNLIGKNVHIQSPPESSSDYCIEALLPQKGHTGLPDVYNGVRVLYVQYTPPDCSPVVCADGTTVGCYDVCDESGASFAMITPVTIILAVVLLSACCCCLRRRKCRARCRMNVPQVSHPSSSATSSGARENIYPAEQYHLLSVQQQEQDHAFASAIPVQSHMGHAMYPPMPVIPPQMMMPNGAYPVMMQASDGMWYAVPHPNVQQ